MTSTIVLYCLLLIKTNRVLATQRWYLRVNVYQTGQFETKQMNGCAKNTKTKNAIFSLNRRCFPWSILKINLTPICLTVHWNDDLMLLLYFISITKKTSPVFRWTGRILGQNDTKEVNTCTSDDFDPEFCESRGYVLLSSTSECSNNWFVV